MRGLKVIAIIALLGLTPSAALGQGAPGIGPYHLGMTADEVRAIAARPGNEIPAAFAPRSPDEIGAMLIWRGKVFSVIATETANVVHTLSFSSLSSLTPQACLVFHTQVIRDLADQYGPLDEVSARETFPIASGDPASSDTPTAEFDPDVRTLSNGTIVNVYSVPQMQMQIAISGRAGPPQIDASSWSQPFEHGAFDCTTTVTIWDRNLRASANALHDAASPPQPTQSEATRTRLAPLIAASERVMHPTFTQRPEEPVWRFYPRHAVDQRQEGDVAADCLILADGALDCLIVSEEPLGWGFGEAALQVFAGYRVDISTGVVGKYVRMRMPFRYT